MLKTKVLKFRRGGNLKSSDVVLFGEQELSFVNEYEYLGVTVQPTWTFTRHFRNKRRKFNVRMNLSKGLRDYSLEGAVRHFNVMLRPIVTYGLEAIWQDLSVSHFELLDCCQWDFFKRVLGLHKSTRNRLVFYLCDVEHLSLVCAQKYGRTPAFDEYVARLEDKLADVDPEFFSTPAYTQSVWKQPMYEKRHLATRASTHGFHFKLCTNTRSHDRSPSCICRFCGFSCGSLLHVFNCNMVRSLEQVNSL